MINELLMITEYLTQAYCGFREPLAEANRHAQARIEAIITRCQRGFQAAGVVAVALEAGGLVKAARELLRLQVLRALWGWEFLAAGDLELGSGWVRWRLRGQAPLKSRLLMPTRLSGLRPRESPSGVAPAVRACASCQYRCIVKRAVNAGRG